ncbi:AMP-binding protein [Streptomyces anulatus]|uniref:AMP-binding protein n=1 Tax=Streptomyces anulatus TaxID=1892 RepID=UPI00368CAD71
MLADPDRPLAEAPLPSSDGYEVVTRTWACAARPADPPPVQAAFEAQRRRTPHAPEALWHDRQLTYEELGAAADRLAHQLIRTGSSGRPVGILMDRCLDMTVAVLAYSCEQIDVVDAPPAACPGIPPEPAPLPVGTLPHVPGHVTFRARLQGHERPKRLRSRPRTGPRAS